MNPEQIDNIKLNKVYGHHGGGRYLLLAIADESTNARVGNKIAVYVSLKYGIIKCRDLDEFFEEIEWPDGKVRTRFILEEELEK